MSRSCTSDTTHESNTNCEHSADVVDGQPVSLLEFIGITAHGLFSSVVRITMFIMDMLNSIAPNRARPMLKVSDVGLSACIAIVVMVRIDQMRRI